jgi:hypothetical protein
MTLTDLAMVAFFGFGVLGLVVFLLFVAAVIWEVLGAFFIWFLRFYIALYLCMVVSIASSWFWRRMRGG